MHTIEQVLDLDSMREEIADLGEQVAAPDMWDNQDNAQRVTGRLSMLNSELDRFTNLAERIDDLEVLVEMGTEESDADTMEIGRESCRERVCKNVSIKVVAVKSTNITDRTYATRRSTK